MTVDGGKRLGWGILGPGRIVRDEFLPALTSANNARLASVGSRSIERARSAVALAGAGRPVASYADVVRDDDVDAIYIALPNALHYEWIMEGLAAGKHVLCEKPLVVSLTELDDIGRAAVRANRVVMEAFRYRYQPLYAGQLWQEIIRHVGPPRYAHAGASFTLSDLDDFRARQELGGGALWDLGCYCLSFLTWQFGQPDSVKGLTRPREGVDWSGSATMSFSCGLEATAWWSFSGMRSQRFTLVGDHGAVDLFAPYWELPASRATLRTMNQSREVPIPYENCFRRQIEHLGDVVLHAAAPTLTLKDTRDWLELANHVCEASWRAGV